MKVCHKTCIFFFFPIVNKYLCMAKRSLLSRCPSYNNNNNDAIEFKRTIDISRKKIISIIRDFRLPSRCRCDLRSSGLLPSVEWYFRPDVSGQHMGPIFKCQEAQVIGHIGCPETSVGNNHSTARNITTVQILSQ